MIGLVIKIPSSDIWAVEIKHGIAPNIGKHCSQTSEYYQAINQSTQKNDSAPFIEFMLKAILQTIQDDDGGTQQVSQQVKAMLKALLNAKAPLSRSELQARLGLKDRESFRERYLKPTLVGGLIEMTLPDKPNSRLQQYRLTETGKQLCVALEN